LWKNDFGQEQFSIVDAKLTLYIFNNILDSEREGYLEGVLGIINF